MRQHEWDKDHATKIVKSQSPKIKIRGVVGWDGWKAASCAAVKKHTWFCQGIVFTMSINVNIIVNFIMTFSTVDNSIHFVNQHHHALSFRFDHFEEGCEKESWEEPRMKSDDEDKSSDLDVSKDSRW